MGPCSPGVLVFLLSYWFPNRSGMFLSTRLAKTTKTKIQGRHSGWDLNYSEWVISAVIINGVVMEELPTYARRTGLKSLTTR